MIDLTHNGVTQPLTEWALDYGIPAALIRKRLLAGWTERDAIVKPMPARRGQRLERASNSQFIIQFEGRFRALHELVREHGLSRNTVLLRLERGWTLDDAILTPARGRSTTLGRCEGTGVGESREIEAK